MLLESRYVQGGMVYLHYINMKLCVEVNSANNNHLQSPTDDNNNEAENSMCIICKYVSVNGFRSFIFIWTIFQVRSHTEEKPGLDFWGVYVQP